MASAVLWGALVIVFSTLKIEIKRPTHVKCRTLRSRICMRSAWLQPGSDQSDAHARLHLHGRWCNTHLLLAACEVLDDEWSVTSRGATRWGRWLLVGLRGRLMEMCNVYKGALYTETCCDVTRCRLLHGNTTIWILRFESWTRNCQNLTRT